MDNVTYNSQTYYLMANKLYPYNPSLEDELNRLLGWKTGNFIVTRNDFSRNGIDSEHVPDENSTPTPISYPPTPIPSSPQMFPSVRNPRIPESEAQLPQPWLPMHRQFNQLPQPEERSVTSSVFQSANRRVLRKKLHCSFCKNNGERELVFASHNLKTDHGIIICPVLRNYTCPICRANGDRAHTLKYCPLRAN